MPGLEDIYPSYDEQIRAARDSGFSDQEIQSEFQSLIREKSRSGQTVAQIQAELGQKQPGFLERLATGPVGEATEFGLSALSRLAPFPGVIKAITGQGETLPKTRLPSGEISTDLGALVNPMPEAVSQGFTDLTDLIRKSISPEAANLFEASVAQAPFMPKFGVKGMAESALRRIPRSQAPELISRIELARKEGFTPEEIAQELDRVPARVSRPSVEPSARGPEFFSTLKELGYTEEQLRTMPFSEKVKRARERIQAEIPEVGREKPVVSRETLVEPAPEIAPRTPEEMAREAQVLEEGKKFIERDEPRGEPPLIERSPAEGRYVPAPGELKEAVRPAEELGEARTRNLKDLGYTDEQMTGITAPQADDIIYAAHRGEMPVVEPAAKPAIPSIKPDIALRKEAAPVPTPQGEIEPSSLEKFSVYRGSGRPDQQSVYTFEGAEPIFGKDAQYFAFTGDAARKFGPNVERVQVKIKDPLVIKNNEQWRALTREAEVKFPDFLNRRETFEGNLEPFYADRDRVVGLIRSKGHDGVVITPEAIEQFGGRNPLEKLFGDPQIIQLGETKALGITSAGEVGTVGAILPEGLRRTPEQIRIEAGVPFTPSRQKIISDLSSLLEVPIRYGKVQAKNTAGFFKVKPEVIRTKFAQDVETASHEVGHFLEKSLFRTTKEMAKGRAQGLTGAAFKAYRDELTPIATKHNKSSSPLVEGFAEFVRRYVTHDAQARQVAPRFYEFFDGFLDQKHPDVRQVLLNARKDYETYMTVPATGRVRAQISRMPEKQTWSARDVGRRFYTLMVDQLAPIARIKEELLRGRKISADNDPELLARTFAGWARKADLFVNKGPRDFGTLQKTGPGLDEITGPIRDRWEDFWDYAAAVRATTDIAARSRAGLIKGTVEQATGISLKDWQDTVKAYDSPLFRDTLAKVQEYKTQVLDYMADSYGLPEYELEILKQMNANHVPFHRVMDDPNFPVERGPVSGGGTFGNQPTGIRQFKGSQRQIIDPAESIIKNTFTLVNLADRNAVVKSMVDLARQTPGGGKYVEDVPFDRKPTSFQLKEIKKTLEEVGIDTAALDEGALDTMATIFRANKMAPENHVMFWENGKQKLVRLDPELYKTMQGLDKESSSALVEFLRPAADLLRVGATTTLEFAARNPLRDQWSVAINTGLGIKTPYFTARGLFHILKQDAMYEDWIASGAAHSTLVKLSRAEIIKRNMELGRNESTARTFIRHPWQSVRLLSQLTEEATRVGQFESKLGGVGTPKAGMIEAGAASREGSFDPQRMGAKTQALHRITAFWNPNLQGLDRHRRAAIEDPLGFATRAAVGITLPSIALTLYQMNDARWKEIPQWQKDGSWVILTGPHVTQERFAQMTPQQKRDLYRNTIWRIPKAFELGVIFGSIPERIVESIAGQHKGEVGKVLLQSFVTGIGTSLVPMPTMFAPLFENWANWSNFTARPIVPKGQEDLEPALQAKAQTTAIAKKIGEAIHYSPAKIDNLIRGYTGGLGILGAEMSSSLMDTLGIVDLPEGPARTLADIPGIRGFTVRFPSSQAESIDTFWEKYADSQEKVKSWKRYLAENRAPEAERYYQNNRDLIERSRAFARGAESMRAYSKAIANIWKSNELSPQQKRDAIDQLYVENIDLARGMLKALYPQRK